MSPGPALVSLLLLAGIAGCGGNGETVSKEEFIAQANASCVATENRLDELGPEPVPTSPDLAPWLERMVAAQRDGVTKLRALPPPDDGQAEIEEMLSSWQEAVEGPGTDLVAAAREGDESAFANAAREGLALLSEGQRIAREYGLDRCTSFGVP